MNSPASGPLRPAEVDALMAPFDPFEPEPEVAVAVSGGADSTALAVLLDAWARARGGRAVALIVDHGLRRGSGPEAAAVRDRLAAAGLEAHVLAWTGPKPEANQQAAARRARYRLLAGWCGSRGILHLALAHHREDQAETFLLRLGRGSGLDGLAAMPRVRELAQVRLLRPLLGLPRARLEATLRDRGLAWVEDPSNRDESFSRVRLRKLAPSLAAEGLTADRLAKTAGHLGRARAALEAETARLLARAVTLHPAGFAWVEPEALTAASEETGSRALARLLTGLGGSAFAPRWDRLERLYRRIRASPPRGATLAGCRILERRGRLLIVRESRALPSLPAQPGQSLRWDGRFDVLLSAETGASGLTLGPLGSAGWQEISQITPEHLSVAIPPAARPALPALRTPEGLISVPHLGFYRAGTAAPAIASCRFALELTLTAGPFRVA